MQNCLRLQSHTSHLPAPPAPLSPGRCTRALQSFSNSVRLVAVTAGHQHNLSAPQLGTAKRSVQSSLALPLLLPFPPRSGPAAPLPAPFRHPPPPSPALPPPSCQFYMDPGGLWLRLLAISVIYYSTFLARCSRTKQSLQLHEVTHQSYMFHNAAKQSDEKDYAQQ